MSKWVKVMVTKQAICLVELRDDQDIGDAMEIAFDESDPLGEWDTMAEHLSVVGEDENSIIEAKLCADQVIPL